MSEDTLTIAGVSFNSRLITGTGKHRSQEDLRNSVRASGTEIITVAIGRLNLEDPNEETILDALNWDEYTILPNTAGAKTADQAVGIAKLAREVTGSQWIKLEVIPNPSHLLPDPVGTFDAAKTLIAEGFTVLPYIHADPVLAAKLQDIGCATVMPLGSPIGSGRGVLTAEEIAIIVEQAEVPVVVDAGLGVPSDAAIVMEMGADAVLVNTAIARAEDPAKMGEAFKLGVEGGRMAFLAGRIPISEPTASSPQTTLSVGN